MPQNEEEQLLHASLLEGLSQFFDMIPVSRPLSMKEKRFEQDVHLVCQPDFRRSSTTDRLLCSESQMAASFAVPGQVASVTVADAVGWRGSAAGAALLAMIACTGTAPDVTVDGGMGAEAEHDISQELAALLHDHPQSILAAAVRALCQAQVLRFEPCSRLQLSLTPLVSISRDVALRTRADPKEVSTAMRCFFADNTAAFSLKERVLGAMVSVALGGTTSGYLDISVKMARAAHGTEATLSGLDQFTETGTVLVTVSAAAISTSFPIHCGTFLTQPLPLESSPSSHKRHVAFPSVLCHHTAATLAVNTPDVHFPLISRLAIASQNQWVSEPETATRNSAVTDTQLIRQHLADKARSMLMPLHAHLAAVGVIQRQFVPLDVDVSDSVMNACMQCMRAIESALQCSGVSGACLGELLSNAAFGKPLSCSAILAPASVAVLGGATADVVTRPSMQDATQHDLQEASDCAASSEALTEAAQLLGGLFALHSAEFVNFGVLAFDCSLWTGQQSTLRKLNVAAPAVCSLREDAGVQAFAPVAQAAAPSLEDTLLLHHSAQDLPNDQLPVEPHPPFGENAHCQCDRHCSRWNFALVCAGIHVALSLLHTKGSITLHPHLGASMSCCSAYPADMSLSDTNIMRKLPQERELTHTELAADLNGRNRCKASKISDAMNVFSHSCACRSSLQFYDKVAAPWEPPSGGVSCSVLKDLIAQMIALLAVYPGMPEYVLAVRMQHALGRVHLQVLLQVMLERNQVRCATVPAYSACLLTEPAKGEPQVGSILVPVSGGLLPGIFAGALQCRRGGQCCSTLMLPLQHHYFLDVASSMAEFLHTGASL